MDRLLDLDAVAAELVVLLPTWVDPTIDVAPLLWRDAHAAWPQPLLEDRSSIREPESLGVRLWRGSWPVAELVLWRGGWADVTLIVDGDMVVETPSFNDVRSCIAVAKDVIVRAVRARL